MDLVAILAGDWNKSGRIPTGKAGSVKFQSSSAMCNSVTLRFQIPEDDSHLPCSEQERIVAGVLVI